MLREPSDALAPRDLPLDQRPPMLLPRIARRFHPQRLVHRDADPDLHQPHRNPPARPITQKFALLLLQRLDLELPGALTPAHAAIASEPRHRSEPLPRLISTSLDVIEEVAGGDRVHWERKRLGQLFEVDIDRLGLPARVGEYRRIRHRLDLARRGHQRHRRRLNAGPERDHAHHPCFSFTSVVAHFANVAAPLIVISACSR
jgi:hypothetical protein